LCVCVCVTWKPSTNWLCYPWTTKDKSNEAKLNGDMTLKSKLKSVFDSVVASAFQITFRAKIHVNNVFLFFKNYCWHQHIKTIQNVQIILNFSKKKIQIFWERSRSRFPKRSISLEGVITKKKKIVWGVDVVVF
jgi:hypothetical protein